MIFVDTNYFLRFLINDNHSQYLEAKKLFSEAASGKITLFTSTLVLFEVYWVFKSYYQKNKSELVEILQKILKMNFIEMEEREILEKTLEIFFQESLSLEDCYNFSYAKNKQAKSFKTFDIKLQKYASD